MARRSKRAAAPADGPRTPRRRATAITTEGRLVGSFSTMKPRFRSCPILRRTQRHVVKPGALREPHRQAAFARGIDETVRFMNELLEHGVVRWIPASKARQGSGRSVDR